MSESVCHLLEHRSMVRRPLNLVRVVAMERQGDSGRERWWLWVKKR